MLQSLFADCSSTNYPELLITVFDSVNCSQFIRNLFKGAAWVQQELLKWAIKWAHSRYNHWQKHFSISLFSNTLLYHKYISLQRKHLSIRIPLRLYILFYYCLKQTSIALIACTISLCITNKSVLAAAQKKPCFVCLMLLYFAKHIHQPNAITFGRHLKLLWLWTTFHYASC